MNKESKIYKLLPLILVFVGVPLLLWALGEFPKRSVFKELLSLIIILTFSLLLGQFFLTRTNKILVKQIKMSSVLKIHKFIGYVFIIIIMAHPFFIILPKFFDNTKTPFEAFTILLTSFNSLGIVLGMVAYMIMLIILITSFFRFKLHLQYRTWRKVHGYLAMLFIITATSHVINIGRYNSTSFSIYYLIVVASGIFYLLRIYLFKSTKKVIKND
ncbi:ferric reductase-like transmembrane domain-containing protein [Aureibaculum luteum]|uniref:ferric reductase-like transmembrane domain-containing protein n=1 Tax=Aureibaculum luteum TaxID=1548456 RepID=UPI00130032FB|nr:ferric reductase-like transmembrane domain-containing protein [Aureibaculum luteum]